MEPSGTPTEQIRFGVYELDLRTGELRKSGVRVRLQDQSFQILQALLKNPGEVVTREELRKTIWPADTFVDFDHGLYSAMTRLREVLGDSAETPRFIETLSRRGYRFVAPVDGISAARPLTSIEVAQTQQQTALEPKPARKSARFRWAIISGATVLIVGIAVAGFLLHSRKTRSLTAKDTIVLADFTNTTGDSVFDSTLKQGLSVQLDQSPFLSIISDQRVQQTLRMMGQKPDARLTPEIARELCQRTGSSAVLDGAIAQVGERYLLTLKAVNCANGESLASSEAQADDKNHVLDALGAIAREMRSKLGESLDTLQKFNTPLIQATTPSLEALQAFSLGWRKQTAMDFSSAIPFYQQAISLDPNFAAAYLALGTTYNDLGQGTLASEDIKIAYALRNRVSEREAFSISDRYYDGVTGDLDKAAETCELWVEAYPRDPVAFNQLSVATGKLGQLDKSLAAIVEASRIAPTSAMFNNNLVLGYLVVNRFDEALATIQQSHNTDSPGFRFYLYQIDFFRHDTAGMADQVARSMGGPFEDYMLAAESDTAAYSGHLSRANDLAKRAISSAEHLQLKEDAAGFLAGVAVREALFGDKANVGQPASAALHLSTDRNNQAWVAVALALSNHRSQAQTLANDLARRFPEDTIVRYYYLPTIRAAIALDDGKDADAIDALQVVTRYEFDPDTQLHATYVRGMAYLAAHQGALAAAEFQKILDHPGIVLNEPIGALAHLGLARAYSLSSDTTMAKTAYQDFFALWKDADPDIPILKQAKAEYAKLQ